MKCDFNTCYKRLLRLTETKTQVQLAEILGIRQSSVSDAKRRGEIPASWLITALQKFSINPHYILHGDDPQMLYVGYRPLQMSEQLKLLADMPQAPPEYLDSIYNGIRQQLDDNTGRLTLRQSFAYAFLLGVNSVSKEK